MIFHDAPQYSEIFYNILANIFHNLPQHFTIFRKKSKIFIEYFTIFDDIPKYFSIFHKSHSLNIEWKKISHYCSVATT